MCNTPCHPLAKLIEDEATAKLGGAVSIDVETPVQAYDTGGRARAMSAIIKAMAEAKAAGIDPDTAMRLFGRQSAWSRQWQRYRANTGATAGRAVCSRSRAYS